jgi:hypothetical protein
LINTNINPQTITADQDKLTALRNAARLRALREEVIELTGVTEMIGLAMVQETDQEDSY